MRKIFSVLCATFLLTSGFSQNQFEMNTNNVAAKLNDQGLLFHDFQYGAGYEVPAGSGKKALYSVRLGFGGKDINGQVHMALAGYQGLGQDFFRGPVSQDYGPLYQALWDTSYYHFCQQELDDYLLWWECQNLNPPPAGCIGMTVPTNEFFNRLYNYPAHGDLSNGQDYFLSPFYDYDTDGIYNPGMVGDYPAFDKGCCWSYMLFNDDAGIHTYTGAEPLGIQVKVFLYQYDVWGGYLDNVTFMDVIVENKSTATYYDFNSSLFIDADLGNYSDDYFGSDSTLNMTYFYNADNNDENNGGAIGYGLNPPAIGIVNLTSSMSSSLANVGTANTPVEIYNIMNGVQASGVPALDENNQPTSFEYHDDPNNPTGWSEVTALNPGGDRRAYMSAKDPVFGPGDADTISYAIIFAEGTDNLNSVTELLAMASDVKFFFDNDATTACENNTWGITEELKQSLSIYPNPSKGTFHVAFDEKMDQFTIQVIDLTGRVLVEKSCSGVDQTTVELENASGVYLVHVNSSLGSSTQRIVIE